MDGYSESSLMGHGRTTHEEGEGVLCMTRVDSGMGGMEILDDNGVAIVLHLSLECLIILLPSDEWLWKSESIAVKANLHILSVISLLEEYGMGLSCNLLIHFMLQFNHRGKVDDEISCGDFIVGSDDFALVSSSRSEGGLPNL